MKTFRTLLVILFALLLTAEEKKDLTVIRAAQMLDVKTGKLIANPVLIIQVAPAVLQTSV